ncbi:MAG: ATP-binding protein [Burkholderiaceae bacterium]
MSAAHTPHPLAAELAQERQLNQRLQDQVLRLQQDLEVLRGAARDASNSRLLAEEELDDTRDRLQLALDAAQLALWEWNLRNDVVYLSARWSELMGDVAMDAHTPLNELLERIHPDDLPGLQSQLRLATEGHLQRYEVQFRIRTLDDEWLWLESHGMVTEQDQRGRALRLIGVCADIRERKRLEQATETARTQAESANRAKTDFLANVSHEVRTPLNGVMGLIRLLMDSPLDTEQSHWLQLMDESAHTLLGLLNDILDLSKIEAGKMTVEATAFDAAELTEKACAPLLAQASAKQLQLEINLHPGLPTRTQGDPGRLRQVLTNLLSNAVKFTPAGGHIRVSADPVNGVGVRFEVADTGIGISPEQQARVFEAFTQADASTTRKFGGTGLGLAISARLVTLMGGQLQLDSQPGQGSRFFFTLPLKSKTARSTDSAPLSAPMELAHISAHQETFDGLRVLVAEDHPVNELLMRQLLQRLGCVCTVAKNGLEAVAAWRRGGIDLIMMDVQMPELSGLEATAEIRAQEGNGPQHTPIVAVTANAMSGDEDKCLQAGMDAYTSKPVSPQALMQAMSHALAVGKCWTQGEHPNPDGQHRPPAPKASGTPPPGAPPARNTSAPPLDADKLRHRLGHNPSALAELARTAQVELASHQAALTQALAHEDKTAAATLAHTLKGALAGLTAHRAAALANGLEMAARSGEWPLFGRALPVLRSELAKVDAALQALQQR